MKKIISIFLSLIFLAVLASAAGAGERVVLLTIPGCSTWGSAARISSILQKINGVKKHENKENSLVITFDDEETSLQIIVEELKKGRFNIKDEPVYLR